MSPAFCLDEDQYMSFMPVQPRTDSFNELIIRKLNMLVIANTKNSRGGWVLPRSRLMGKCQWMASIIWPQK